MQNKGVIRFFAIVFALACIYELSFTWITRNIENDAKAYANDKSIEIIAEKLAGGDNLRTQKIIDSISKLRYEKYLDSMNNIDVYNLLVAKFTYDDCKKREINLGLDLKGGMNVVLEISVIDVIRALSNNNNDELFEKTIQRAKEMQEETQADFVTLFGNAFEELAPEGAKLAAFFSTIEMKDRITPQTTNEEVLTIIREEAKGAIDNSFNILRKRIDQLGVTQPNIQRLQTAGRILVELPGVKNPENVRALLQSTAKLEFWQTYESSEVYPILNQANTVVREIIARQDSILGKTEKNAEKSENIDEKLNNLSGENQEVTIESDSLAQDSTKAKLNDEVAELKKQLADSTSQLSDNELFDKQQKLYPLFTILRPHVNPNDNTMLPGPIAGYAYIKDTAEVNYYLRHPKIKSLFDRNMKFLWTAKPYDDDKSVLQLIAIKITDRNGKADLEGDVITNARKDFGATGAEPSVSMSMNAEGANAWKKLTKQNIGKSIAIVLDKKVYSFPTVRNEIATGQSEISGNFTVDEADRLANLLKSGKLPAPARIVEEEIVGPSLGKAAITSGLTSFIIALIVVLIYMVFYYNNAGLVANVALLSNVFFIMGVLASLGATLTLPGIAGVVLTIGMSVDANVLIYERIREELKDGKGMRLAVVDGYKKAYSSIIDANVTTLLTGIILFIFGSGPIKGFATTLIIGILTSLFSAIFITQLIFNHRIEKNKNIPFDNAFTRNAFKNLKIKFIEKRKMFYLLSGIIIVLGIGSLAIRGLNYGVDFTGGRSYVVRFDTKVDNQLIKETLATAFTDKQGNKNAPEVKTYGSESQVKITTNYLINERSKDADKLAEEKLIAGLNSLEGHTYTIESSRKVGPTIADDIRIAAFWSILFSLIGIFLYILIRFRKWQFSLGAVVAVFHDVLIVLSLFSFFYGFLPFSLEIDQAFIAAVLTLIGYSINDTVVVFDRIREFMGLHKKLDLNDVTNKALNSTVSRTVNTSVTTFVVLLTIFIFGGEVIRGFMFALMVGVLVGTYSSLFVASPIMVDTYSALKKRAEKKLNKNKKK